MNNKTIEQIEADTRELEAIMELYDNDRGFCMLEQSQIDANIARNAFAIVFEESSQFLFSYVELLNETDELIFLNDDAEIMTKVKRWETLLEIAKLSDDFMLMLESVSYTIAIRYLRYDETRMLQAKQTAVKLASTIINALDEAKKTLYGVKVFDYDYSELIAEQEKYWRIAKGETIE